MTRRLNWRPSLPSHKDVKYKLVETTANNVVLPSSVDLRPNDVPIFDQGDLSSCSGNALAGAVGYLEKLELKNSSTPTSLLLQVYSNGYVPVSRLQIYWNERVTEGTTGQDAGATTLRDGCDALLNKGVCEESLWPYLDENVLKEPTPESFKEALNHKISVYYKLETLTDMKRCLYHGFPFTLGFTVFDSFLSDEVAQTGVLSMPGPNENCQGGHAVLCVGYDDKKQCLIIRNSWGTSWGMDGYFTMPYNYAIDAELASDFFTLRKSTGAI